MTSYGPSRAPALRGMRAAELIAPTETCAARRPHAIEGGGPGRGGRSVSSSGCSRLKLSATRQSQHTGTCVASTSITCSGRKSSQLRIAAVRGAQPGLAIVPVDGVEGASAERARLALVPVGEDVAQQAGLGRGLDLAQALLAAARLLRPARAGIEAQVDAALRGAARGVSGVDRDRHDLAVLRTHHDARAAIRQPGLRDTAAEDVERPQPDENEHPEHERHGKGHGNLLFRMYASAGSPGIERLIRWARAAAAQDGARRSWARARSRGKESRCHDARWSSCPCSRPSAAPSPRPAWHSRRSRQPPLVPAGADGGARAPGARRPARRAVAARRAVGRAGGGVGLHVDAGHAARPRPGHGLGRDRGPRGMDRHERPRGRERAQRARRPAAARRAGGGRVDPAAAQPPRRRAPGGPRSRDRHRGAQGRGARPARARAGRLRVAAAGAAGDGLRQPARARELGEPRRRERGRAPAQARRPDDLRADRRVDQPGQQRRPAGGRGGPHGRAQHA